MEKSEFTLLNKIQYPEDLRKLSVDELPQLCQELRKDIIEEVAVNPGHLASSLGVAEMTVALHYVYNTPEDVMNGYDRQLETAVKEMMKTVK